MTMDQNSNQAPKPVSKQKGTRYFVQVANCVFDDCVKEYRRLLKTHGYKSRMVKSSETSSMAEVVSNQVIGDEASVKLVNQINSNNRDAGQAYRTKGKQGYRISMGLFPDLERAGWLPRLDLKDVVYYEKWEQKEDSSWKKIEQLIKTNLDTLK